MIKLRMCLLFCLFTIVLYAQPPESYDLRNVGGSNYVTSVKSQLGGTCWTFGSMASMESNLLMTGNWHSQRESGEPDLAEYHLDWWNGYNQYFNQDLEESYDNGQGLEVHMGGDYRVVSAYISRLEGSVREIDANSYDTPSDRYSNTYKRYYPKHIEWYNANEDLSNIDIIKEKIMEHGVMAICLSYSNDFMSGVNHYQPPYDNRDPNHSVSIIGWNDNRVTQAPGPGAWLVKNSWGSNWGMAGYFWISYYDKHACKNPEMGAISFVDVDVLAYDTAYYHDYHGWRDTLIEVNEAFNAFVTDQNEEIVAISFFSAGNDVDYTVKVYGEFSNGELFDERISHSGSVEFSGLHTIDLPDYINFLKGEKFYVYLELSHGGQPYDRTSFVPVLLGGSNRSIVPSTTSENQSFYKLGNVWHDFYHYDEEEEFENTGNFCIKALANHNPVLGIETMYDEGKGGIISIAPSPFSTYTHITYHIHSNFDVELEIYSLNGQLLEVLIAEKQFIGEHVITWENASLSNGVYLLNMKTNGQILDQKKIVKVQ